MVSSATTNSERGELTQRASHNTVMGGRTACDSFGAEFFPAMLLQRALTFLLLFSYGVPAILGPAWHSHAPTSLHGYAHGHANEHCGSHLSDSSGCLCVHQQNCRCEADTEPSTFDSPATESTLICGDNSGCHGPCSICTFYAQATWSGVYIVALQSGEVSVPFTLASSSVQPMSIGTSRARGPPQSLCA